MLRTLVRVQHGAVGRLTLDSPGNRNALSVDMLRELQAGLRALTGAGSRCIVLDHTGPAFSSGHDLKQLQAGAEDRAASEEVFRVCSEVMMEVAESPAPVIAQVDGVATAAGAQLVASADLAYASEGSRFATPGVNIGLFCSTPAVPIARVVAPKHAMHMLLTGDLIDAATAERYALINQALPQGELAGAVAATAGAIASKPAAVIRAGKTALRRQLQTPTLAEAYEVASSAMVANLEVDDCKEGLAAFFGKRKPNFN